MKKSLLFIGLGIANTLHAALHLIQFIQSIMLFEASLHSNDNHTTIVDKIIHSPYLAVLWGVIGLYTLYIGIKDFIHHKKCNH